jgi:3-hydroxyisobutyrate dehydrogenase-like beta-hydroxyacid dehydrogenase
MAGTVGVIGVGMMGRGIAKNLLRKDFEVLVKGHRDRAPVDDLVAAGAAESASPAAMAEAAEIVVMCVTAAPQVEAVVFGDDGLAQGARPGLTVIDCSTIDAGTTAKIHAAFTERGADFADAPLARSPKEAEEGRLNTMVGAEPDTFARIRPVLEAFCENIFHVGPPGAGQKTKLLNNFFTMGQAALIAEALCAAAAAGVDIRKYFEVISAGGGNSGIFQMLVGRFLESGDYDGLRFGLKNAEKDLRYFVQMTRDAGLTGALGQRVHLSLLEGVKLGFGEDFVGGLIGAQAKLNGVDIEV